MDLPCDWHLEPAHCFQNEIRMSWPCSEAHGYLVPSSQASSSLVQLMPYRPELLEVP